jgi:hypothetical protein
VSCEPLWSSLWANWDASSTIALLALVAATFASFSAHRSAQEAKRANAQAMYHERRAVFDAFLDLSMHMQERGQAPDKAVVGRFYRHHHTAAFCFDKALAKEINAYFEAAQQLADYCGVNPGLPKLPPEEQKRHEFVKARSAPLLEQVKKAVPVCEK